MFSRRKIVTSVFVLTCSACANIPHNNVLLFGTDTKVGFDVSSSATSGGSPQITLGYKRDEAVWLPLVANTRKCSVDGSNCKVEATESSKHFSAEQTLSANVVQKDSLSVFASFGAQFAGEGIFDSAAANPQASSRAGLAQFFATGVAAQNLASNDRVAEALNAEAPEATEKAATADISEVELRIAELEAELSAEDRLGIIGEVETDREERASLMIKVFESCGHPPEENWKEAIDKFSGVGLEEIRVLLLKISNSKEEALNHVLAAPRSDVEVIEKNYVSICGVDGQ